MQFNKPGEPSEEQKERAIDLLFETNRGVESVGIIERDKLLEGYTVTLYCERESTVSAAIAHESGLQYWPFNIVSPGIKHDYGVTVVITRWPKV